MAVEAQFLDGRLGLGQSIKNRDRRIDGGQCSDSTRKNRWPGWSRVRAKEGKDSNCTSYPARLTNFNIALTGIAIWVRLNWITISSKLPSPITMKLTLYHLQQQNSQCLGMVIALTTLALDRRYGPIISCRSHSSRHTNSVGSI